MPVARFSRPEDIWGYDLVTSCYSEDPALSADKIQKQIKELYPAED